MCFYRRQKDPKGQVGVGTLDEWQVWLRKFKGFFNKPLYNTLANIPSPDHELITKDNGRSMLQSTGQPIITHSIHSLTPLRISPSTLMAKSIFFTSCSYDVWGKVLLARSVFLSHKFYLLTSFHFVRFESSSTSKLPSSMLSNTSTRLSV